MTRLTIAVLLVLSAATAGLAQEDILGNYDLRGVEDGVQFSGRASVQLDQRTPVLHLAVNDGSTQVLAGTKTAGGNYSFALPTEARGVTGVLTGADSDTASRTILISSRQGGLAGTIQSGDQSIGTIEMRRQRPPKSALLVWSFAYSEHDQNAFHAYATELSRYYRHSKGYGRADVVKGESFHTVIDQLKQAAAEGRPYQRLVMIGHGGWDGPVIGSTSGWESRQVSGKQAIPLYNELLEAIRTGMTPSGKIFSSSCHAGGSNVYERAKESSPRYNWTHDLALRTGRTVAGPAGYTSTEYTFQNVKATLEGEGVTKQEVHVAGPQGLRIVRPSGALSSTRVVEIPEIHQLPAELEAVRSRIVIDRPLGS